MDTSVVLASCVEAKIAALSNISNSVIKNTIDERASIIDNSFNDLVSMSFFILTPICYFVIFLYVIKHSLS
jgi:hypothetical protein